jgi:hypothetical protein
MANLTRLDLEKYIPQKDALALLEDIDTYFSGLHDYAGTQTQQQVALKRVELQDRAKLVTPETVIFLKALEATTGQIAVDYVYKEKHQLPDPWPHIRRALNKLMTIVWLHVVHAQFNVYGGSSVHTIRGLEHDIKTTSFRYTKCEVMKVAVSTSGQLDLQPKPQLAHMRRLLGEMGRLSAK